MGERTPYTQRVDEDLQYFVDTVSHRTNLSKADVIDEALRRLKDASTISEDGQFVVNDSYGDSGLEADDNTVEQLIENQQQMMQMLASLPPSAENKDPDKNTEEVNVDGAAEKDGETGAIVTGEDSASEVERRLEDLAGEYDHDECLDPEEIGELDTYDSEVVSHTRRYLIPAITGMLNHRQEHGVLIELVEWTTIKEMMQTRLGVSRGSLYNYREGLVNAGVLYPHPSIDDDVVGEDTVAETREYAAAVTDDRSGRVINVDSFGGVESGRYVDDADAYLGEFVSDWGSKTYYLSEEAYREDVWGIVQEAIRGFALTEEPRGRRPNHDDQQMYRAERAAGANRMLAKVVRQFGVCTHGLHEVRNKAVSVSNEEELEEWATRWAEVQAEVKAELSGDEADVDEAKETFREEVGVDPDGVDDDELRHQYKTWVKENHPDAGGDVEPEVFGDVMQSRNVLLD